MTSKTRRLIRSEIESIDEHLKEKTKAVLKEKLDLTYGQAFKLACSDNRALTQTREQLRRSLDPAAGMVLSKNHADLRRVVLSELESVDEQMKGKTKAVLKENPDLTYGQAFKVVCSENRTLAQKRERMMAALESPDRIELSDDTDRKMLNKIESLITQKTAAIAAKGLSAKGAYLDLQMQAPELFRAQDALRHRIENREYQAVQFYIDKDKRRTYIPDQTDQLVRAAAAKHPDLR